MSRELRANVEEYLRIRRALGFQLEDHGRLLVVFIDHLEASGPRHRPSRPRCSGPPHRRACNRSGGSNDCRWCEDSPATCTAWTPQCRCRPAICWSIGAAAPRPT